MKMSQDSYKKIVKVFSENREALKNHRNHLRNEDNVNNLEVRLGFDGYYALLPMSVRREIREKDNLNDQHLQTGILKALKECDV